MKVLAKSIMLFLLLSMILTLPISGNAVSRACCVGMTGNVNGDGLDVVDISDLTYLVAYLFQSGPAPPCEEEADVNGSMQVDVSDLTYIVAYMFQGGPYLYPCP